MVTATLIALALILAGGVIFLVPRLWRRAAHYAGLSRLIAQLPPPPSSIDAIGLRPVPDFGARLAVMNDFLPDDILSEVRSQAERLTSPERNYIPTHKKGGTIAYETIIERAPRLAAFYQSRAMTDFVSRIVGVAVKPTPLHDQSSLSVLCYERPGDHIGWHYDYNFYRGRHFTVLLPIINQGSDREGLSHARLIARLGHDERDIPTPPNTLVVFEGAKVLHRVVPIAEGERRLVVSMTYCVDPRANVAQELMRRAKDVAFYGPRALWT